MTTDNEMSASEIAIFERTSGKTSVRRYQGELERATAARDAAALRAALILGSVIGSLLGTLGAVLVGSGAPLFTGAAAGFIGGGVLARRLRLRRGPITLRAEDVEEKITVGTLAYFSAATLTSPDARALVDPWYQTLSAAEKETFDALVEEFSGSIRDLVAVTRTL